MTTLTVALLFPVALLLLVLAMEQVERPLALDARSEQLGSFLASAQPDETEKTGEARAMGRGISGSVLGDGERGFVA